MRSSARLDHHWAVAVLSAAARPRTRFALRALSSGFNSESSRRLCRPLAAPDNEAVKLSADLGSRPAPLKRRPVLAHRPPEGPQLTAGVRQRVVDVSEFAHSARRYGVATLYLTTNPEAADGRRSRQLTWRTAMVHRMVRQPPGVRASACLDALHAHAVRMSIGWRCHAMLRMGFVAQTQARMQRTSLLGSVAQCLRILRATRLGGGLCLCT
jgi:hypothetical protein